MRVKPLFPALAVALVVSGAVYAVDAAAATGDEALVARLDQVFSDPRLAGATIGLQVRDAGTGDVVYSHNAEQRVVPASNEKLMTSAAALEVLGLDYTFHTRVSYSGTKSGSTVAGNLYLKGTGDPTLSVDDIDALAADVAAAGITTVSGNLVGDNTWFDTVPLGLDWSWEDEGYANNAPISALTFSADDDYNTASFRITTTPAASGTAAVVAARPSTSALTLVNNAVTGAAGSASTISVSRAHGTNTVTVTGSIPAGSAAETDLVSVSDAAQIALGTFRLALTRHGVTVGSGVNAGTPSTATPIADHESITLGELLPYFLKLSNNGHAELLTKAMGRAATPGSPGSWSTGLAAASTALAGLGVDTTKITMGDGSGLTRRDWLTTEQLSTLLYAARSRPWFDAWYNALPIAGRSGPLVGGTLASRMAGTPAAGNVHAKTGTLSGVNALSGFVTDASGRELVFSSVSNAATANVADLLDTAAVTLASYDGTAATARSRKVVTVPRHVVTRDGADIECSWVPDAC